MTFNFTVVKSYYNGTMTYMYIGRLKKWGEGSIRLKKGGDENHKQKITMAF